jgi:hypothetical protein
LGEISSTQHRRLRPRPRYSWSIRGRVALSGVGGPSAVSWWSGRGVVRVRGRRVRLGRRRCSRRCRGPCRTWWPAVPGRAGPRSRARTSASLCPAPQTSAVSMNVTPRSIARRNGDHRGIAVRGRWPSLIPMRPRPCADSVSSVRLVCCIADSCSWRYRYRAGGGWWGQRCRSRVVSSQRLSASF